MKKIKYFTILLISVLIFTECGKYDEGPTISFRSRQKRIEGLWKVDKFLVDNTDSTSFYTTLLGNTIDIKKDNWEIPLDAGGTLYMGGEWNWHNLKYYVNFNLDYAISGAVEYQSSETDTVIYGIGPFILSKSIKWEIERIATKELILSTRYNNMIYRVEMSLQKDYD